MRCNVERDAGATGTYGSDENFETHLTSVPCYWWVRSGREVTDSNRAGVVVADEHLLANRDADIRAGDRIVALTDHRGRSVFGSDDYREVEHVAIERSHIDCALRATSGTTPSESS